MICPNAKILHWQEGLSLISKKVLVAVALLAVGRGGGGGDGPSSGRGGGGGGQGKVGEGGLRGRTPVAKVVHPPKRAK